MKYVLVQWSSGNIKTSILTENYVRDKSMLYDCTKEGIISFVTVQRGDTSVIKNKGKLGRIACVSDDRKLVEEHQNLLLAEESEFIEDEIEHQSPPRSSKRPRIETDVNGIGPHGAKRVASDLQEELLAEKEKVRELQILNQTLQKKLPELLRNAMNSSKVIIKLRTCPNCNQFYGNNGSTVANISTMVPEPIITTQDRPSTSNVANTMPDKPPVSSVHSTTSYTATRSSATHSSATPMQMLDMPMVSMATTQPSMVDISTDFGSPEQPSTPDTDLAMTLPGLLTTTSEADNMLHKHSSPESLRIVPLYESGGDETSVNDLPTENAIALQSFEVTYATTYRKMTLALLSLLFDQETLKLSSVTGAGMSKRPALEKTKVQYIIDAVKKSFPDVTPKAIKATMAQKCKYLRKPNRKTNTSITNDDKSSVTEEKSVIED